MLTFLDQSSGTVLGVKVSGKLTHADYRQLADKLEAMLGKHDKVRVLIEMEDCQGWDIGAAWENLRFAFQHDHQCERCAVVGDKKWQEWMTRLAKPFFNVRYFDHSQLEEAWRWANRGLEDDIRRRAYEKWQEAGRPPSNGVSFWLAAEKEVLHQA